MAIQFEKPQPLMVGDKAYYTLSSYDPVQVKVTVPLVTDADVTFALATLLAQMEATPEQLSDHEWFAQHFPGLESTDALVEQIGLELEQMNMQFAEQQKIDQCRAEITRRLNQSVPAMHLARVRESVRAQFEQSLAMDGITLTAFLARSGASMAQVEQMLDEQARASAEEGAALDAFARERKLAVSAEELGDLLGVGPEDAKDIIAQARAAGQYDDLMDGALRMKALAAVVSECDCTYHHETEEEARERLATAAQLRGQYGGTDGAPGNAPQGNGNASGLHLV
jgi:FKBP-type peptidyl-prolyl cis-trans isomerase (trigger factor)